MCEWKDSKKELPDYDKPIKYVGENGRQGFAYLSKRTNTWKCLMTSDSINTNVLRWKYEA